MSERGSFVTEFIYCPQCLKALKEHLIRNCKYLKGIEIPAPTNGNYPIIAGKIGELYPQGEADFMEEKLTETAKYICEGHSARVVVITDSGPVVVFLVKRDCVDRVEELIADADRR